MTAGRGPFLGPLVYACAYWPEAEDARISRMGFDGKSGSGALPLLPSPHRFPRRTDSKALTDVKRRSLFKSLQAQTDIGYVTMSISAEAISEKMLRRSPISLNAISHDAAEQLVRTVLDAGGSRLQ